jgi:hypothetical protein
MKHIIKILAASLAVFAGSAQSREFSVSLIAYKDCHSSINSLEFSAKPQVCNMSSQALTLMVRGQNIAVIDKGSLKFSKLDVGGKDVRYNRKGDNAFKFGSFPKIDENGEYAIFDAELKSAPFGYIGSASLAGTIDIMTGTGVIKEERNAIILEKSFSLDIGPLTLSNQPKPIPAKLEQGGLSGALGKGIEKAFMGQDSDSLNIYVNGNHDSLVSLDVYEKGKELKQGWYTTSGEERRRSYAKPTGSKIDLKVKYWDGMQRVTVPIELN